jgi:hypothetical protein
MGGRSRLLAPAEVLDIRPEILGHFPRPGHEPENFSAPAGGQCGRFFGQVVNDLFSPVQAGSVVVGCAGLWGRTIGLGRRLLLARLSVGGLATGGAVHMGFRCGISLGSGFRGF